MLIAHYIGNHDKDDVLTRIGWAATRLVQRGRYSAVTHCEAIHRIGMNNLVTIASASLRDGGVRVKHNIQLTQGKWLIIDVPQFSVDLSIEWFAQHIGQPYDLRGALATVLPGTGLSDHWFCNETVAASVDFKDPQIFGPAQFASITASIGTDVTQEFFKGYIKNEL